MLAHRRAAAMPRLAGRDNYKEWSQKAELHLRINKLWAAVLAPPNPIRIEETGEENFIFVASRKNIYIQCPNSINRRVLLYFVRFTEPYILPENYHEMSVPLIWRDLKRRYGIIKPKNSVNLQKQKKSKKNLFGTQKKKDNLEIL